MKSKLYFVLFYYLVSVAQLMLPCLSFLKKNQINVGNTMTFFCRVSVCYEIFACTLCNLKPIEPKLCCFISLPGFPAKLM